MFIAPSSESGSGPARAAGSARLQRDATPRGEGGGPETRHLAWPVQSEGRSGYRIEISPSPIATRRTIVSDWMTAEIVHTTGCASFETRFLAPVHLLVVHEQCARRDGESCVEGLPRSTLRDLARKLTFVPAGREYHEWHEPRTPARLMYVYFDPAMLGTAADSGQDGASFTARLLFDDATLLDTALKLKRSLEGAGARNLKYLEALGVVLAHEIVRLQQTPPEGRPPLRGGLAAWQRRLVAAHIDAHLGEAVSLAAFAELTMLSPSHFCRAFRQSFGVPPHKYHTNRRIEHAKTLLATRSHSVTEIGMTIGYSETSSFTAAFRKAVGLTPSAYLKNLDG
jgi:AraC family transcriptional regulator